MLQARLCSAAKAMQSDACDQCKRLDSECEVCSLNARKLLVATENPTIEEATVFRYYLNMFCVSI